MGSNNLTARNNRSFMGQVCRVWTVEEEHLVSSVEAFWCGVWSKIQEAEFLGSQPRM